MAVPEDTIGIMPPRLAGYTVPDPMSVAVPDPVPPCRLDQHYSAFMARKRDSHPIIVADPVKTPESAMIVPPDTINFPFNSLLALLTAHNFGSVAYN